MIEISSSNKSFKLQSNYQMKILFFSAFFYPKVGGLERIALSLAEDLSQKGHEVRLVTLTALNNQLEIKTGFEIIRNPSKFDLFKLYLWSEVFFHHHLSLFGIWPYFLYPVKKTFILNQLTYDNHGHTSLNQQIKRQLTRFFINISCSNYVNHTLPKLGEVIWNSYDDHLFRNLNKKRLKNSIVFLGRLVTDKGCKILLEAIAIAIENNLKLGVNLVIIGDGPEKAQLVKFAKENKIENYVTFKGLLNGKDLVQELNQHQIMVIPSIWKEPFGIVALEALACGCLPIYSDGGGLAEACGEFGLSFKRGDKIDLAHKIQIAIENYDTVMQISQNPIASHLKKFTRAQHTLQFEELIKKSFEN